MISKDALAKFQMRSSAVFGDAQHLLASTVCCATSAAPASKLVHALLRLHFDVVSAKKLHCSSSKIESMLAAHAAGDLLSPAEV
jgi:hypothetical protein